MSERIVQLNKVPKLKLCKAGGIRMSMWMGSICAATGAESLKIWPFW